MHVSMAVMWLFYQFSCLYIRPSNQLQCQCMCTIIPTGNRHWGSTQAVHPARQIWMERTIHKLRCIPLSQLSRHKTQCGRLLKPGNYVRVLPHISYFFDHVFIFCAILAYFVVMYMHLCRSSNLELSDFDPDEVSPMITSSPEEYGQSELLQPIHSSTPHRRYLLIQAC